jgi:hypothetical protein
METHGCFDQIYGRPRISQIYGRITFALPDYSCTRSHLFIRVPAGTVWSFDFYVAYRRSLVRPITSQVKNLSALPGHGELLSDRLIFAPPG